MSTLLGQLRVAMSLDSAAFERGSKRTAAEVDVLGTKMQKAGHGVTTFGKSVLAAGGIIAGSVIISKLKDIAVQGLESASALGEQAKQLGVSTKALQEYRYIATQVGLEQSEMEKGLAKLTRSMGDAVGGAKGPSEAFAKLGIDVKAFVASGKDAGDMIPLMAQGLQGLASESVRASTGAAIMGRNFQQFMPLMAGGASGIAAMRKEVADLGIVMDDAMIKKADDAADKMAALNTVMKAKLSIAVVENVEAIESLTRGLTGLITSAGQAAKAWRLWRLEVGAKQQDNIADGWFTSEADAKAARARAKAMRGEAYQIRNPNAATGDLTNNKLPPHLLWPSGGVQNRLGQRGAGTPGSANWGPVATPNLLKNRLAMTFDQLTPGPGITGGLRAIGFAANDADVAVAAMTGGIEGNMARLDRVLVMPAKSAAGRIKIEFEQLGRDVDGIMRRLFPDEAMFAGFANDRAALAAASKAGGVAGYTPGQLDEAAKRLRSEEFRAAFEGFKLSSEDMASHAELSNTRIVRSFKDMADGTIGALDRVAGAVRGGGFLNVLSSVLGLSLQLGSIGLFGKGVSANINATPRAMGGPVQAGRLHLVGERGPELFVPGAPGKIVPNHALGGMSQVQIVPSPYFDVVVDGRVMRAAPAIAQAGGALGEARVSRRGAWALR